MPERISLEEFKFRISKLNNILNHGCGSSGCVLAEPSNEPKMVVNNVCKCRHPHSFVNMIFNLACDLDQYDKYEFWQEFSV